MSTVIIPKKSVVHGVLRGEFLPDEKQCKGPCRQLKPRKDFTIRHIKTDGLDNWCKQCRTNAANERKAAEKKRLKENNFFEF